MKAWPDGLPRAGNLRYEKIKSISSWFEIYQVNQDTYAILEPNHDEEVFSYLLLGNKNAALIDTGMGIADIRTEIEQLTNLPVQVINTHTHFDHTGGNHRFNNISCFGVDYELNNLKKGHDNSFCKKFMSTDSYRDLPNGFDISDYYIKPSKITNELKHLEQIDLGERILLIHHTPGHSPGSICIQDTKYKILFTGDTFYTGNIFMDLPGSNEVDFYKSVRYLSDQIKDISFLCPGHNEAYASKEMIQKLNQACLLIRKNEVDPKIVNNSQLYIFDDFNLRLP